MRRAVAIGLAGRLVLAGMVAVLAGWARRGQSYVPEYGGVAMKVAPVVSGGGLSFFG